MNRKELVVQIAEKTKTSHANANHLLQVILGAITKSLKKNGLVRLQGFGSFTTVKIKARTFYNIKTREPFKVKGKKVVRFKVSPLLQKKFESAHPLSSDNHV